jgi:hypothetical protein
MEKYHKPTKNICKEVIDVYCRFYCSEGKNLPQLLIHLAKLM